MFERIDREDVLRAIQQYGPLQPLEVKRRLGKGETTMIGAVLSELAHNKRVAITDMKRGSSPFYYDPNNPASLERVAEYLGEKDRRTYALLKEKRVIYASTVEPLTRVSLANIKDYSKPFKYVINGEEQLFFRYFLVNEEQAKHMVEDALKPQKISVKPAIMSAPATAQVEQPKEHGGASGVVGTMNKASPTTLKKEKPKRELKKPVPRKSAAPKLAETQQMLAEEAKTEMPDDSFFKRVARFCKKKEIKIKEWNVIRKGGEIDFVVSMSTSVGRAEYYIKAKSKKKSNDGDIAAALLAGQIRRLPTIYLTTGEVTKKAKDMTQSELKGVIIKEIKP